jgi:hypothetical protein
VSLNCKVINWIENSSNKDIDYGCITATTTLDIMLTDDTGVLVNLLYDIPVLLIPFLKRNWLKVNEDVLIEFAEIQHIDYKYDIISVVCGERTTVQTKHRGPEEVNATNLFISVQQKILSEHLYLRYMALKSNQHFYEYGKDPNKFVLSCETYRYEVAKVLSICPFEEIGNKADLNMNITSGSQHNNMKDQLVVAIVALNNESEILMLVGHGDMFYGYQDVRELHSLLCVNIDGSSPVRKYLISFSLIKF